MICLRYSNSANVGATNYLNGFIQSLYLDADITGVVMTTEVEKSEQGSVKYRSLLKRRSFTVVPAPEWVTDALSLLPVMDYTYVIDTDGEAIKMQDVEVQVSWEDECFASVVVSFSVLKIRITRC